MLNTCINVINTGVKHIPKGILLINLMSKMQSAEVFGSPPPAVNSYYSFCAKTYNNNKQNRRKGK